MIEITCETCGKKVLRKQASHKNNKHHYCSPHCHYKKRDWLSVEVQFGGVVRMGRDIGYKSEGQAYIWHACIECGKRRWVQLKHGIPGNVRCNRCANNSPSLREKLWLKNYKGGRHKNSNGYIHISVPDNSPYVSMRNATTYVMEHRLVVAQSLCRCLEENEIVHHLNGIRDDNRLSNLLLVSPDKHRQIIPALQKRIQELEATLKNQGHLV